MLVALYLQQALRFDPQHAGLAMVPTSVTGFVVSLTLLPRVLRALGPRLTLVTGMVVLAAGHLWLAYAPTGAGYAVAVLPGLLLVATGVAFSFTPTTMVIAGAMPDAHAGLASGLAGSATQVGSALGTSVFTAIGIAVAGTAAGTLGPVRVHRGVHRSRRGLPRDRRPWMHPREASPEATCPHTPTTPSGERP